jgi:hypothetical protein
LQYSHKQQNTLPWHCYQTITEPPHVSLLVAGIPNCRLSGMFSKRGAAWRTTHLTISRAHFQLSDVHVLWSWRRPLRIWALLSVIRGLEIAALLWMFDLWSSRRTVFVETGSSRWIFSSTAVRLCCSTVIFRSNPSQCPMTSFCHCWVSPTVPLGWCLPMIRVWRRH